MNPTVDRYRYPWRRLVPGDRHTVVISRGAIDLSANVFELVMVDAYTGTAVPDVVYVFDMVNADVGVLVAVAEIPADIDTTAAAELRLRQTEPHAETLVSGPVIWAPSTIPAPAPVTP